VDESKSPVAYTGRWPRRRNNYGAGKFMDKKRFTVKEEHLKLLRAAYVSWDGGEFGAPAIDCKRPYGNSDVYTDIAEILGIELRPDDNGEISEKQRIELRRLHEETQVALQIVLATGQFAGGNYEAGEYDRNWREI
jgi:hypothetical protein